MTTRVGFHVGIVSMLAALLLAPAAPCAPSASDKANATVLFDEALKLLAKKEYAEACKKLEESLRLDPQMGTKYRLAECWEHVGKTASAWGYFREVADEAKATNQVEREKKARDRANKLEAKLSKLTIVVATKSKGIEIKRDGAVIGEGQLGVAMPVDPGAHLIEATAPGKQPWSSKVEVAAATTATVNVPVLEDEKVEPKPEKPIETRKPVGEWQKPTGIAVSAIGVVSLGLSTVFILSARSSMSESASHCVGNACDAEGTDLRSRAVARGNLSTVFFVTGVVCAAGGAVLYLTAPSSPEAPRVGIGPGFVTWEGRF